jgi:hypothetical protein
MKGRMDGNLSPQRSSSNYRHLPNFYFHFVPPGENMEHEILVWRNAKEL